MVFLIRAVRGGRNAKKLSLVILIWMGLLGIGFFSTFSPLNPDFITGGIIRVGTLFGILTFLVAFWVWKNAI